MVAISSASAFAASMVVNVLIGFPLTSFLGSAPNKALRRACASVGHNAPKPAIHGENVHVRFRVDASDDAVVRVNRYGTVQSALRVGPTQGQLRWLMRIPPTSADRCHAMPS